MLGTALITINENQWSVEVANTIAELSNGLSGRASLPAGTGMLFILPTKQAVTVQTNEMLFPIDIIFINNNLVLSVAQSIEPGLLVEEATPCDGFLEINALEAALVEIGDTVTVEITTPPSGFDFSSIMTSIIPLVVLGFVFGMLPSEGSSKKELKSGEHHSIHGEPRRRLVEKYGSWQVSRAESVCPEGDVACVAKEAKRLSEVYRSRHGEEEMKYYTILSPGQTVFHIGDVVSEVALTTENNRARSLGENVATYQTQSF